MVDKSKFTVPNDRKGLEKLQKDFIEDTTGEQYMSLDVEEITKITPKPRDKTSLVQAHLTQEEYKKLKKHSIDLDIPVHSLIVKILNAYIKHNKLK